VHAIVEADDVVGVDPFFLHVQQVVRATMGERVGWACSSNWCSVPRTIGIHEIPTARAEDARRSDRGCGRVQCGPHGARDDRAALARGGRCSTKPSASTRARTARCVVASRGTGSELIFVDDGSTDDTARLLDAVETVSGEGDHPPVAVRVCGARTREKEPRSSGIFAARCPLVAFCDIDLATPLAELGRIVAVASRVCSRSARAACRRRSSERASTAARVARKAFNRPHNCS